jgi:hypothetical protein
MKIDSSMSFDEKLAVRVHNMSQCAGCALVAVGTALRHTSLCASLHLSLLLSRRVTLAASAQRRPPSLATLCEGAEALTQVMNELWGDGVEYQVSTASFPVKSRLSSQMLASSVDICRMRP